MSEDFFKPEDFKRFNEMTYGCDTGEWIADEANAILKERIGKCTENSHICICGVVTTNNMVELNNGWEWEPEFGEVLVPTISERKDQR